MTINAPNTFLLPENEHLFNQLSVHERLALLCREKTNKENLLAGAKVDIEARTNALKNAAAAVLTPLKADIKVLNDRAEAIVTAHREILLGKKKTMEMSGQSIAFRKRPVVECDDEKQALEELEAMMQDTEASDADRISAQACLRFGKVTLDKEFIRKAAKKTAAWLAGFGLRVNHAEKLSIKGINSEEEED